MMAVTQRGGDHPLVATWRAQLLHPGTTKKFRDWRRWGHGWLDVYRAIEVSADTYFYDLAYRVGIDKINSYMTKFGFASTAAGPLRRDQGGHAVPGLEDGPLASTWYQGTPSPSASARATGAPPRSSSGQGHQHPDPERSRRDAAPAQEHRLRPMAWSTPPSTRTGYRAKSDTYRQVEGRHVARHQRHETGRRAFANTPYKAAGKSGTAQVVGQTEGEPGLQRGHHRWSTATTPCSSPSPLRGNPRRSSPWCWRTPGAAAPWRHRSPAHAGCHLLPPEPQLPPAPETASQPSEVAPNE